MLQGACVMGPGDCAQAHRGASQVTRSTGSSECSQSLLTALPI